MNHNPKINLKNTTKVRNTLQNPFKLYNRDIRTNVIGDLQHTSNY